MNRGLSKKFLSVEPKPANVSDSKRNAFSTKKRILAALNSKKKKAIAFTLSKESNSNANNPILPIKKSIQ